MDIKMFLNGNLDEDIFIDQPKSFLLNIINLFQNERASRFSIICVKMPLSIGIN